MKQKGIQPHANNNKTAVRVQHMYVCINNRVFFRRCECPERFLQPQAVLRPCASSAFLSTVLAPYLFPRSSGLRQQKSTTNVVGYRSWRLPTTPPVRSNRLLQQRSYTAPPLVPPSNPYAHGAESQSKKKRTHAHACTSKSLGAANVSADSTHIDKREVYRLAKKNPTRQRLP